MSHGHSHYDVSEVSGILADARILVNEAIDADTMINKTLIELSGGDEYEP